MKRSAQIAVFCLSFVFGVVLSINFGLHFGLILILISSLTAFAAIYKTKRLVALALLPIALILGANYYHAWQQSRQTSSLESHMSQTVEVIGRVDGTSYWNEYGQFISNIEVIKLNNKPASGNLRISSLLSNAKEGNLVSARGKLYQTKAKADAQMLYANTKVISTNMPLLVRIKVKFTEGLNRALPSPMSEFASGVIIGNRSALPTSLQDQLTKVGLSHVVAVSGYNLTILIMILAALLKTKWKWLNFVACLWIILGFVLISGASASIVRAGVMCAIFLTCKHYGRKLSIYSAMFLAILITILINPTYITSDLSWQLSFSALFGIVLFSPVILQFLPKKFPRVSEILAITLAAQILTMPLVAYKFGQVSLVAPIANLIVMPVVPAVMILALLAGLGGLVMPSVAGMMFLPLTLIIRYILNCVSWFARFSFSSINIIKPSVLGLTYYYAIILTLVTLSFRTNSRVSYNRTEEFL